jgi:hypothetical protein
VRKAFAENRAAEGDSLQSALSEGREMLELVRRQALINGLYHGQESVMTTVLRQRAAGAIPSDARV